MMSSCEYIIDIGLGECWEKNCQTIEFTTAHACITYHIIITRSQENDAQQIKKNIRLKFPEFSVSFAKFSNSLSFPCREFLLAMFPVFPVFPVPWLPCHILIYNTILQLSSESTIQ